MERESTDILRFFELVNEPSISERSSLSTGISLTDVFEVENLGLELANDGCNALLSSLIVRAQVLVNTYQSLNRGLNSLPENKFQKNYYYPRVNIQQSKGSSFTIEWIKSNYLTNSKTGKHFIRGERIKKEGKKGYKIYQFNKAPDWAKPIIVEYEKQFQELREQYEEFKNFKRSFLKLIRYHNDWTQRSDRKNSDNPLENFQFHGIKSTDV